MAGAAMAGARRCLQWRSHRTAPVFEPSLSKVHTAYSMASVETFSGTLLESQGGSVGRQRQVLPGRFLPDCCSCWLSGPPSIILGIGIPPVGQEPRDLSSSHAPVQSPCDQEARSSGSMPQTDRPISRPTSPGFTLPSFLGSLWLLPVRSAILWHIAKQAFWRISRTGPTHQSSFLRQARQR
jgi:hypothetical protein